ncbi:Tyrosine-protein phosphatase non-receptor type 1 [Lobosporangium transversale]|uniref:Protein-tyrosine phosphatase-like protein n=1 Tax=Lobosporangium transversale TaxID=64571 RepID=A0A1Y2GAL7_9FUNG|nr:protein-tyrosine phosphatase-like protein [Lobosporangium transversale]KAF9908371.1 Tyrosine-protein phosphatase non-receptor type 1 [Lobosporangium transversale]ORZ05511.1 protein-tyrosine phosphatase-like protein [Lobosporangium transversale]|eukprot:XP_021877085.1 protein-tyrosine phosphatase-like protein [Lobosporangium transversale]
MSFSRSSTSASSATARLPGFLRPENASSRVEAHNKLFSQLNQLEASRLQAGRVQNSPFTTAHALLPSTRDLNRYADILPYKHTQVVVGTSTVSTDVTTAATSQQPTQTYINANRISAPLTLQSSLPKDFPGYIATQAPLPHTQARFWRMVYEQNVHVIVCLTAVSPVRVMRSMKAEQYWPQPGWTDPFFLDLHVKNLDATDQQDVVVYRHFEVWNPQLDPATAPKRQVLLVHYQGWPDHGVPEDTKDLRDILYSIRAWKAEQQSLDPSKKKDFGPIVVNCSAGCGRTGTFCVVDTALSVLEYIGYPYLRALSSNSNMNTTVKGIDQAQSLELQEQKALNGVYDWHSDRDIIYEILSSFRQDRMLMVQTATQYSFCYQVIRDLCQ